jgi:hypothetical protein
MALKPAEDSGGVSPGRRPTSRGKSETSALLSFEALSRSKLSHDAAAELDALQQSLNTQLGYEKTTVTCDMCGVWIGAGADGADRHDWLGAGRIFRCYTCDTLPMYCALCARKTHFGYTLRPVPNSPLSAAQAAPLVTFAEVDEWMRHDLRPIPCPDPRETALLRAERAAAVQRWAVEGHAVDDMDIIMQEILEHEAEERRVLEARLLNSARRVGNAHLRCWHLREGRDAVGGAARAASNPRPVQRAEGARRCSPRHPSNHRGG